MCITLRSQLAAGSTQSSQHPEDFIRLDLTRSDLMGTLRHACAACRMGVSGSTGRGPGAAQAALAESGRFQAGLVSLGALHTRFGHIGAAATALQEAVRTCQQHNDAAMLAHALAGLAWLLRRTPLGPFGCCNSPRPRAVTAAHHAHVQLLLRRWGHHPLTLPPAQNPAGTDACTAEQPTSWGWSV